MASEPVNNNKVLKKISKKGKRGFAHIVMGRTGIIVLMMAVDIALHLLGYFWLYKYFSLYSSGTVILKIVMLIYLLNSSHDPTVKLTWCVIIAIFPFFGTFLYFFIKLDLGHRLEQKMIEEAQNESASYRTHDQAVTEHLKEEDRSLYNLAEYLSKAGFDAYSGTDVNYFPVGEDMLSSMLEELEKAEKFIFMEYFIVAEGKMWDAVLEILERKAASGVEVRFMYDGTCAFTNLPYGYPERIRKMGIQCKMFAPFRPFVTTTYNNRDHRKITVIDGKVAFTGGINLADEYINEYKPYGHWKDTGILVRGEAVRSFTCMFLQLWYGSPRDAEYAKYLPPPEDVRVSAHGVVIPYGDSPLDNELVAESVYNHILNSAKEYVYIMTPYLILDNNTLTSIKFAAQRGLDIRLILPYIQDKKYASALAKTHYRDLLNAGVRIFEYTPGFIHAKQFLCDDDLAVVGTINLDYRSLYHHFECAALIYKADAIRDIKRDFADTQALSHEITLADVKREKLLTRIAGVILKIIAPLM